jgi:hypothetical protein
MHSIHGACAARLAVLESGPNLQDERDLPEAGKTDEPSKVGSVGRIDTHDDPSNSVRDPTCKYHGRQPPKLLDVDYAE